MSTVRSLQKLLTLGTSSGLFRGLHAKVRLHPFNLLSVCTSRPMCYKYVCVYIYIYTYTYIYISLSLYIYIYIYVSRAWTNLYLSLPTQGPAQCTGHASLQPCSARPLCNTRLTRFPGPREEKRGQDSGAGLAYNARPRSPSEAPTFHSRAHVLCRALYLCTCTCIPCINIDA